MEGTTLYALYALIITSILTPIFVGFFQFLIRRSELKHAEAREDEVAKRVFEASKLNAATAAVTIGKLDVIHGLVNSQLQRALQAELDALVTQLALMQEVIALRRKDTGEIPTNATLEAIKTIEARVSELRATIAQRITDSETQTAAAAAAAAIH